jgi:UDP-N-acetylmuramoyl-L-alanyl-D-glutamate--2,6-diaminopimelate ligase
VDRNPANETLLSNLVAAVGDLVMDVRGDPSTVVAGVAFDSRRVHSNELFVCIPGTVADGHEFADEAVRAGATSLCVTHVLPIDVPQVVVGNARKAMARMAAAFFGHPAEELMFLGVTGTNGKTTTAFLLESILIAEGRRSGLIGTIETHLGDERRPGVRTTPESVDLQRLLREMRVRDVDAVAMEVTSHGLVLERVEGIRFRSAAFTNLSQDHLDFHSGMDDYFEAKRSLFRPERLDRGAVNVDDEHGRMLVESSDVPTITFGLAADADVRATEIAMGTSGTTFTITTPKGDAKIRSHLAGDFNVYNNLAAAATALQAGIGLESIEIGLSSLASVPGRFESIDRGQPFAVIVDYAHTPEALDNVLRSARAMADRTGGKVTCVFGCGGDRDRGKRPLMGAIAAQQADRVIVTSDNPRSERPQAIIDEILEGLLAHAPHGPDHVLPDRREAISVAIEHAGAGDVVVIAGKGHESGQEFADRTVPFDDRVVAGDALSRQGWDSQK